MNKTEKAEHIAQIKELLQNSYAVYLVDYAGINVGDISNLRREFHKESVTYKVFKNTLVKRAMNEVGGYESISETLAGMTGFIFTGENFVSPAKIIKKYSDDKKKFAFKGAVIESTFYGSEKLDVLASMPSKPEIMSSIIGSIAQPATGIVGVLNAVMRDLVSVIDEISKKEAA
jgi:large subunit ribosomal protein L10